MAGRPDAQLGRLDRALRRFRRDTARRSGGGGAPIRLTINDDGPGDTRGFDRVFVGLGATIDAFPSVLRDVVPVIRAAHRANFRTEGAAGRGRWAPLKPRTLADRRRRGYPPGPILTRSGALREHVLGTPAKITRAGTAVELRIAPGRVVDGVPKYRALARGYGPGNLPARPMVAVGPAEAVKITSAISRELRRRAAANGAT